MDENSRSIQKIKSLKSRIKQGHPRVQLLLLVGLVVKGFALFYGLLLLPNLLGLR